MVMKRNRLVAGLVIPVVGILLLAPAAGRVRPGERPYLAAAESAAAWIKSSAIRTPGGLNWPADPKDPKSVNTSLYAGTPGIVLFFLEACSATGNQAYLQDARGGADTLLAASPQEQGMGLYEGLSGVLFALEETFKATGDVEGIELTCLNLPIEEIFYRFIVYKEWEVSEISMAKYVSLTAAGDESFWALPVFPSRVFRHSSLYVRKEWEVSEISMAKYVSLTAAGDESFWGPASGLSRRAAC